MQNHLRFPLHLDAARYRSILCLNGDLPEVDFFKKDLPIIAADGAANTLIERGITPNYVVGDLDSVRHEHAARVKTVYRPDQNSSDFQKSLEFMQEQNLFPSIITGINGGHIDHILNNIGIFSHDMLNHAEAHHSVFYAPPVVGLILSAPDDRTLSLPIHTKLSLMGMPHAIISTHGLKWELDHYHLSFPGQTSCFNRSTEPTISIHTQHGCALLMIYSDCINDAGC